MSSASDSWRCDVDGGWTTIVWTLPSDAVSSVSSSASMTARPAGAPALDLERQHPAAVAGTELARRDVVLRMAREARIDDASHAVLTLQPASPVPRVRGVAIHPDGEGQQAAQDEEGLERPERRAGVDLRAGDLLDEPRAARPRRRRSGRCGRRGTSSPTR